MESKSPVFFFQFSDTIVENFVLAALQPLAFNSSFFRDFLKILSFEFDKLVIPPLGYSVSIGNDMFRLTSSKCNKMNSTVRHYGF